MNSKEKKFVTIYMFVDTPMTAVSQHVTARTVMYLVTRCQLEFAEFGQVYHATALQNI